MIDVMSSSIEHVRTGTLRALAVTTRTRSEALPELPTVGDSVPGYESSGWAGLGAPRNTPNEIVGLLNTSVNAGLADPKIRERLAQLGIAPMPMTATEFGKFIADETEKLGKVVRFAGMKID